MRHYTARLTWMPALLALASGGFLRDCVLLACAGLFAIGGFRRRMDQDSPQGPLVAALRCINAGLGALFAAAALLMMLVGAWLEWWQPANNSQIAAAAVLLVLFAAFRALPGLPSGDAPSALHTHTHTHTHTHARTRTHAHTRTHTHRREVRMVRCRYRWHSNACHSQTCRCYFWCP